MKYTSGEMKEEKISGEELFDGRVLKLERDIVRLQNGDKSVREVIRHKGAVAVVPLDSDKKIIMVEQYRYPFERCFLEIPAGKLEASDEVPLEAAKRELREETGARSNKIMSLGEFIPSPAILSEVVHLYLAEDLTFGECDPDEDEFIVLHRYGIDELAEMVLRGEICDGKTQVAILKVKALLDRRGD